MNLTPDATFHNAATKSSHFSSWRRRADAGDTHAADLVRRYMHRPPLELYDIVADPLEQENVIGDERLAEVVAELQAELDAWMADQGDAGQDTEMAALSHQSKTRNLQPGEEPSWKPGTPDATARKKR